MLCVIAPCLIQGMDEGYQPLGQGDDGGEQELQEVALHRSFEYPDFVTENFLLVQETARARIGFTHRYEDLRHVVELAEIRGRRCLPASLLSGIGLLSSAALEVFAPNVLLPEIFLGSLALSILCGCEVIVGEGCLSCGAKCRDDIRESLIELAQMRLEQRDRGLPLKR